MKNEFKEHARLAQLVERGTFNPEVKGSSPLSGVFLRIDENVLKNICIFNLTIKIFTFIFSVFV